MKANQNNKNVFRTSIMLVFFILATLAITACDTELVHNDHDHDGDGVQDHAEEDHDKEHHEEDHDEHDEDEHHDE